MVNQSSNTSKSNLGNLLAVALVIWLLFFGGFSTLKSLLTPARQIATTIQAGAQRVTSGSGAPAAWQSGAAAPRTNGGAPISQLPASQAAAEATANAVYQATLQAVNAAQPAAAPAASVPNANDPATWPTAVVVVPTAIPLEQVTVVPRGMPQLMSNDPPTITPIPTLVYPTPLPAAAAAFELSPDGKCVTVARQGGHYQACQDWPYSAAEANSIADYLRTGLVPGTKVN